jgi:prepilin-type N-terminal cleavage/methylation domain-containing protein
VLTRSRRSGFTLPEVLTSLALIGVLASVVVPTVRGRMADGYENAVIQEFQSLSSAITAYRQDVGHYPPSLDYLSALPANPRDFCAHALGANDIAKWNGPYTSRTITSTYTIGQRDAVQVALQRPAATTIGVQISGADTSTAHSVDYKIDGIDASTAGTLRYTSSNGTTVMTYIIPTRAGAC